LKYLWRRNEADVVVRRSALADVVAKVDSWMVDTAWTTSAAITSVLPMGVATQWPRSA
jgi:hypothetical protein